MRPALRSILTVAAVCLMFLPSASADVPTNMNVQGRLTDGGGVPSPAGLYTFTFRIFDAEAGGTQLWPASGSGEDQTVAVNAEGVWTGCVGVDSALTEAVFQDTSRWLDLTVDNGADPPETLSRIKLKTNPFTYRSASSQHADDASSLDGLNSTDFASAAHDHGGLWDTNGSTYYYNTGPVGVGTNTPDANAALHVAGGAVINSSNLVASNASFHAINETGPSPWTLADFARWGVVGQMATNVPAQNQYGVVGLTHTNFSGWQYGVFGQTSGAGVGPSHAIYGLCGKDNSIDYSGYFVGGDFVVDQPNSAGTDGVQLPPDALSAPEILDEPGIAQGRVTGTVSITSSSMVDVVTVTIQTPAPGYIVIDANGQAGLSGTISSNTMAYQIDEFAGGSTNGSYYMNVGFDVPPSTQTMYLPIHAQRTYLKAAGNYTFRLEAMKASSSGTKYVWNPVITARYFPTSYGTVTTIVDATDAADFESAKLVQLGDLQDDGYEISDPGYSVDLRELELKAARAQAAARKAEYDLLNAQILTREEAATGPTIGGEQ